MNFAKAYKSPRLQRILDVLKDGGWHSTMELTVKGRTVAASTCISELKMQGCRFEISRTYNSATGTRLCYYRRVKGKGKRKGA